MKTSATRRARLALHRFRRTRSPQVNIVLGFLFYTVVGWMLLCLPIFQSVYVPVLDNLFTAASAISTTGLTTVSIADNYNLAGQMIVTGLFQIGGIGYMTLTTYYLLLTSRTMTRWHRNLMGATFTMPKNIEVRDFIRSAIVYTVVMEVVGAVAFVAGFMRTGMEFGRAVWYGIFHSISAFCTAGFGLNNDSFEQYADDVFLNAIVAVLAIAGSLGFIVITDLYLRLSGRERHLSFTTKIVVVGFTVLVAAGTGLIYFTEPIVRGGDGHALLKSFFAAMSAITTVGFNSVPTGAMRAPVLLVVILLMYIGASPSGTAGGMKITTLTAMIAVLKSHLRGSKQITFLGRRIPTERLYVATSTFILYTSLIFLFSIILSYTETGALYEHVLFETASALGTVGLSSGLTGVLTTAGKVILIAVMFIGRVGVLTFGFALLARKQREGMDEPLDDDLAV